jgi:HD-like signal output (HDOD) protein
MGYQSEIHANTHRNQVSEKSVENRRKEIASSKMIENVINNIPKLPIYTADLLGKLLDEGTSIQEVTEIIRRDPPLAGALLKHVNSAYFGLQKKIGSLHHAIAYLGFENIYQIVLNNFLGSIFPNKTEFYAIQSHSIIISIISQEISLVSRKIKSSNPTTIGILHDIGKIIVLLMKEKYPDISEFLDILDDTVIGAKLLARWDLPENVYKVVRNQCLPEYVAPQDLQVEYQEDIIILYLSHVCHDMLIGKNITSTIYIREYLSLIDESRNDPVRFYQDKIMPRLNRNNLRISELVRNLLMEKL